MTSAANCASHSPKRKQKTPMPMINSLQGLTQLDFSSISSPLPFCFTAEDSPSNIRTPPPDRSLMEVISRKPRSFPNLFVFNQSPNYCKIYILIVYRPLQVEELVCPPPPVPPRSPGKRTRRPSDSGSAVFDGDYDGTDENWHFCLDTQTE